jgi:hypothetical protein
LAWNAYILFWCHSFAATKAPSRQPCALWAWILYSACITVPYSSLGYLPLISNLTGLLLVKISCVLWLKRKEKLDIGSRRNSELQRNTMVEDKLLRFLPQLPPILKAIFLTHAQFSSNPPIGSLFFRTTQLLRQSVGSPGLKDAVPRCCSCLYRLELGSAYLEADNPLVSLPAARRHFARLILNLLEHFFFFGAS